MSPITASSPPSPSVHPRLALLPTTFVLGRRVPVATGRRARLLGLARLDRARAGAGLLIPRCRAVHTFGMRFPLDVVFLDANLRPFGLRRRVGPGRVVRHSRARAVLEMPSRGCAR